MKKQIPEFPGYSVTEDGSIFGLRGHQLICRKDSEGYLEARLHRKGRIFYKKVHRLVLEAFAGPCPAGYECAHKDHNPSNNRSENLEWVTHEINMQQSVAAGRKKHGPVKLNPQAALVIRHMKGRIGSRKLARLYGVTPKSIRKVWDNASWRIAG